MHEVSWLLNRTSEIKMGAHMAILEQINEGIKESMRSKNSLRLDTLRMLKSLILAVNARGDVPNPEVVKLFKNYLGSLQEALEQTKAANRPEAVSKLESEIVIVQEFLPTPLSNEETTAIVKQAISSSGAKTKRDIGLVMKAIKALNVEIDGKLAKEIADQFLEG
jgi:uncharacterized protein